MSGKQDADADGERVSDVIREDDITLFGLMNIAPQPGALADAFSSLAQHGISVLMIGYSDKASRSRDLSIMVQENHTVITREILHSFAPELHYQALLEETGLTRMSIDRSGLLGQSQTLSLLAECMKHLHLSLRLLSVSGMNISCVLALRRTDPVIAKLRSMLLDHRVENVTESDAIVETIVE